MGKLNQRHLALKTVMMPRDTNPYGTIFGGVILSQIDQAGAVGASQAIQQLNVDAKPLVTVAMNRVEFHHPVFVGDTVSYWTSVQRIGTSSISMHVSVEADRHGQPLMLTEADVTYVAVRLDDEQRTPVPVRG